MVTVKPLTVHWHQDSAPIYSVDFQLNEASKPANYSARFATSGGDHNVRIWRLKTPPHPEDPPNVEYLATLAAHQGAINAVKFNFCGNVLAAAGDDAVISLWALNQQTTVRSFGSDFEDRETWRVLRKCRSASVGEIYDLAWSPSNRFLAATSMDKVVSIMDTVEGVCVAVLRDHKHYVQGVAWDPREELLATQSSDQTVLIYQIEHLTPTSIRIGAPIAKLDRCELDNRQLQFHTESFSSFFRRLAFSPDGNLLIAPAGLVKTKVTKDGDREPPILTNETLNPDLESGSAGVSPSLPHDNAVLNSSPSNKESVNMRPNTENLKREVQNCAFVYVRSNLKRPLALLPLPRESLAVKFNPQVFALRTSSPAIALPYRFVYAIATINGVFVYDTEQSTPLGMAANLHYSSLTDLAWSPDGRTLLVTSIDGFCSTLRFELNEFGEIYTEEIPGIRQNNDLEAKLETKLEVKPEAPSDLKTEAEATPIVHTLLARKKAKPIKLEPASLENRSDANEMIVE